MKILKSLIKFIIIIMVLYACKEENNNIKMLDIDELKTNWQLERIIDKQTRNIDSVSDIRAGRLTFHGENCVSIEGACKIGPGKFELIGNRVEITFINLSNPDNSYYEEYCALNYYNSINYDEIFFNNLNGNYSIEENKLIIDSDGEYNLEFIETNEDYSFACFDDENSLLIDSIPENKYYDTDIFHGEDSLIYGKWMFVKKIGGFYGGANKPDFDYFEAKKSGIYGLVSKDSIIEYGKIVINEKTDEYLLLKFELDTNYTYNSHFVNLSYIFYFNQDIMVFQNACTDCYWYHFIRKE